MNLQKHITTENEDATLWTGFQNGNIDCFNELVNKYSAQLFSFAYRFCQDRDILKDCIQELFLDIWNKRDCIIQPASVKWYLFKAIRNRVFTEKRKWDKDQLSDNDYPFLLEFSIEDKLINDSRNMELTKKMMSMLDQLPARQREIIYLRYYENLELNQISELMNISKQSVYNLLQKAYKNIRVEWVIAFFYLISKINHLNIR